MRAGCRFRAEFHATEPPIREIKRDYKALLDERETILVSPSVNPGTASSVGEWNRLSIAAVASLPSGYSNAISILYRDKLFSSNTAFSAYSDTKLQ